ncbi:hypothetical protein [Solidesulfovibrio sp. C21]|uniref:hypothetical protein n=1 Tax=Solidesulfovibrio sp. C21 TaxID=3398613 RepID=UPI0039FC8B1B
MPNRAQISAKSRAALHIASVVTAETLGGRPIYSLLLDRTLRREQDTAPPR